MKIIIFAPYFFPHKGGLEQFCYEISERLSKIGNEVIVVSSLVGSEPKNEKIGNVEVVRLETLDLLGGTFPIPLLNKKNRQALTEIMKNKPDRILTNTRFFLLTLLGLVLAKKHKVKSFHIEHGTCRPKLANTINSFAAWVYDQTFGRLVFLLADKAIAISEAAAKFSESLGATDVKIIYNSIDANFFGGTRKEKADKTIKIIFVGRLIQAKGVQDLIKAVEAIDNNPIELLIVGIGNYESELKKLAKPDKRIKFLGEKNKNEIRTLLLESQIFVNPSFSEGLPTAVLEAGACGLAVIATDVGGTKEIIRDNENGFLIEPNRPELIKEKISQLIEDKRVREQMGMNIKKRVREVFDWSITIDRLMVELTNETNFKN